MKARARGTAGLLVAVALCAACGGRSPRHAPIFKPHDELGARMTGTFVHEPADAGGGESIRLNITRFRPDWKGIWLYAEWARASDIEQPLRQCVFEVVFWGDEVSAALEVYDLSEPVRYAGAWHDPRKLSELEEQELVHRPACTILFRRPQQGPMVGSTEGGGCAPRRQDAARRRIRLEVGKARIVWQEQDFDAEGRAVSGTPDGGDLYEKTANRSFR